MMILWSRNLWAILNGVLNYVTVRAIQVSTGIHRLRSISTWIALLLLMLVLMLLMLLLMVLFGVG